MMSVLEGVPGADQETLRPVSDADETPGLPGAQGGSPDDLHSSVTVTVTVDCVRLAVGIGNQSLGTPPSGPG